MPDEIRAADVFRPPILRRISRDGREENDRHFRERFAEAMSRHRDRRRKDDAPPETPAPPPEAAPPEPAREPAPEAEPRPAEPDENGTGLGHHLDQEM